MLPLVFWLCTAAAPPPPAPSADAGADLSDEEFVKTFGRARVRKGEKATGKPTAYVPPPPGAGGPKPLEALKPQHIKDVVLGARADIARCADGQPDLKRGKTVLTLKWVIGLDGRVTQVELVGDELKGSYVATCVTRLVKRWEFPKHTVATEPIVFPFKL
jgi:hypothetical protein